MPIAISVEGVSKHYTIRHEQANSYPRLSEKVADFFKSRFSHSISSNLDPHNTEIEEFWALRDVNFHVFEGDKLAIIGRNGAGKSTMLKVLSRITAPSTGKIGIKGRIGSLLEVGTGFHPELTGRENIFLNGAILGMTRQDIKQRFDEIVDFAEVERFLDTPVKRYSSGMYVRLAFAVAAHLEPEILLVDEVLAVGDHDFQKKCLGKMGEVGDEGRTVIFVSHNMDAVNQLCNRAILLEDGTNIADSNNVSEVVQQYVSAKDDGLSSAWVLPDEAEYFDPYFTPTSLRLIDTSGEQVSGAIRNDDDVFVQIECVVERLHSALTVGYCVYNEHEQCLYWSYQSDTREEDWPQLEVGSNTLLSKFPKRLLNEGRYRLELIAGLHFTEWIFEPAKGGPAIWIDISGGLSDSPFLNKRRPTLLSPILPWVSKNQQK